ncbi:hypothetical protein [Acetobacter aceti]|nr:hypothetical protein [Acetobacter aceti]
MRGGSSSAPSQVSRAHYGRSHIVLAQTGMETEKASGQLAGTPDASLTNE